MPRERVCHAERAVDGRDVRTDGHGGGGGERHGEGHRHIHRVRRRVRDHLHGQRRRGASRARVPRHDHRQRPRHLHDGGMDARDRRSGFHHHPRRALRGLHPPPRRGVYEITFPQKGRQGRRCRRETRRARLRGWDHHVHRGHTHARVHGSDHVQVRRHHPGVHRVVAVLQSAHVRPAAHAIRTAGFRPRVPTGFTQRGVQDTLAPVRIPLRRGVHRVPRNSEHAGDRV